MPQPQPQPQAQDQRAGRHFNAAFAARSLSCQFGLIPYLLLIVQLVPKPTLCYICMLFKIGNDNLVVTGGSLRQGRVEAVLHVHAFDLHIVL